MMNVQHNEFAERIARIQSGEGSFRSTIYIGNDEPIRPKNFRRDMRRHRARVTTEVHSAQEKEGSFTLPILKVLLAFAVGCAAMILWRMADFHLPAIQPSFANPVETMAVSAAFGTVVAILLCQTVGLIAAQHMLAAFIGVIAMVLGLHNLVHFAPEQFAQLFSPAWVTQTISETPSSSVVFAGVIYPFG